MTTHEPQTVAAIAWKGTTGALSALLAITVSTQEDVLFWLRVVSLLAGITVSLGMTWGIVRKKPKRK